MAVGRLRSWLRRRGDPTFREEDLIPRDERGAPDLRRFDRGLAEYVAMHGEWARYSKAATSRDAATRANKARGYATWGLIAKGAEAVPYAMSLLESKVSEDREDAAAILEAAGKNPDAVAAVARAAEAETDPVALAAMVGTLGRLRIRSAIPIVVRILRDGGPDAQWDAAEALARIARKRFGDGPDRVEKALAWAQEEGF